MAQDTHITLTRVYKDVFAYLVTALSGQAVVVNPESEDTTRDDASEMTVELTVEEAPGGTFYRQIGSRSYGGALLFSVRCLIVQRIANAGTSIDRLKLQSVRDLVAAALRTNVRISIDSGNGSLDMIEPIFDRYLGRSNARAMWEHRAMGKITGGWDA